MTRPIDGRRRAALSALVAWVVLILASNRAVAQCEPDWLPGASVPGVDGPVYAAAAWDPDGPGPLPTRLVIGGDFTVAGGIAVNRIAMWDGAAWQALGSGLTHPQFPALVFALAVHNGDLIVGGYFDAAGGVAARNIARWSIGAGGGPVGWQPLGAGLGNAVRALAVHNGGLVAGGDFVPQAGDTSNHIARWTGTAWESVGGGTDDSVFALAVHEGQLIASGYFSAAGGTLAGRIARWTGSVWQPLGTGVAGGFAYALAVYDGGLIAAGNFSSAGGVPVSNIARWSNPGGGSGTWQPVGQGTTGFIYTLAVHNGDLIAGGNFTAAAGAPVSRIARWNGALWQPLAPGASIGSSSSFVSALAVVDGSLFVGGEFTTAGGRTASRIARWIGGPTNDWQALGTGTTYENDATVAALTTWNGELIAGGTFSTMEGVTANRIARWIPPPGPGWRPLGSGAGATGAGGQVKALAVHQGDLIAAGRFSAMDGVPAGNIVRRTGGAWEPLGPGVNNVVRAVASFDGDLIAGGDFTAAGGTPCARVARWNGTEWSPLGAGLNGAVHALIEFNGQLYAGGEFYGGSTGPTAIARWNGTAWQGLSPALSGLIAGPSTMIPPAVYAFALGDGELFVGGAFEGLTNFTGSRNVMAWNGSTWRALGSGFGGFSTSNAIRALAVHNTRLYAGGSVTTYFSQSTTLPVGRIGSWDGTQWQPLGAGVDQPVEALERFGDSIIAGGRFVRAGAVAAPHWARWRDPLPSITAQPVPRPSACAGQQVAFTVTPGPGQPGLTLAWRRDGTPLADGPTGTGSTISGIATPTLTIADISIDDAGTYDCVLTNACGQMITRPAALCLPPGILQPPAPRPDVCAGADVVFSIVPSGCDPRQSYRWRRDAVPLVDGPTGTGSIITGAATPTLAISGASAADVGAYDCVVSNACGAVTSAGAPLCVPVSIVSQPPPVLRACGVEPVHIALTPGACQAGAAYAWRRNGVFLTNGPNITGATTPVLTIHRPAQADLGVFDCRISTACSTLWSGQTNLVGACRPDADCNGLVEPADVASFVALWYRGVAEGTLEGDFDGNGLLTTADVGAFVAQWFSVLGRPC